MPLAPRFRAVLTEFDDVEIAVLVLAACVVVLGSWVAIRGASLVPPEERIWGLAPKPFNLFAVVQIVSFGLFVGVGVYYRRRPDIHRPMMLMATLWFITPSFDRWFAIGYGCLVASHLLVWWIANSDAWERLATQLL